MNRRGAGFLFGAACLVAEVAIGPAPASAQTFENYHCADGTRFIAAFYPYDSRAHLQIDGRAATLARRFTFSSGQRYSGEGVTLTVTKTGVMVRRPFRPTTTCEPT
ncbi:lysozyme inhibitor [Bradyrhizobium canariense]|uniref:C-type lysozyme inhibitor domain-containing protein n=1 Tax=Bradyrhizobium canariense TaxID=255045 RepID=A0A1H1RB40_9BRAD|nr:lysozyme inhibitor [Bradyrhizobium canariense]SDS32913.1 hypothetical protein SAMN05444158_1719 [Bradyrhizobium canariense]